MKNLQQFQIYQKFIQQTCETCDVNEEKKYVKENTSPFDTLYLQLKNYVASKHLCVI